MSNETKGYTGKQMCEHIVKANFLKYKATGEHPTAEQIWNYSPKGELFMIWEWFAQACELIGLPQTDPNLNQKPTE